MVCARYANLPMIKIRGVDVTKETGLFLLDLIFEDADVFVFWNFNSEYFIFVVTENRKSTVGQVGICLAAKHPSSYPHLSLWPNSHSKEKFVASLSSLFRPS